MENNDYYESIIRTSRNKMSSITINTDKIKFDNDKVEIKMDKDFLQINNKEYIEKQQLISFLKHLIEETECAYNYKENDYKNSGKWNLLNEILDFVNKGDIK